MDKADDDYEKKLTPLPGQIWGGSLTMAFASGPKAGLVGVVTGALAWKKVGAEYYRANRLRNEKSTS